MTNDLHSRLVAFLKITLPLAILPTFFAMDLMGFSLNLVSLLAITLRLAFGLWRRSRRQ